MKAYISISFGKRESMNAEVRSITETLDKFNIKSFVFVDRFTFSSAQEKEMMQAAMKAIDECDLLIAETSGKGIGIGIEVGYAKAKSKPLIYLRNKDRKSVV